MKVDQYNLYINRKCHIMSKKRLLRTNDVENILDKYRKGLTISRRDNILYRNIEGTRASYILLSLSNEEMLEYVKCYNSPIYFIEKYCNIELRGYQKKIIDSFINNRFNINIYSHKVGMTLITSLIYLWYMIFNMEKNILLLYNKKESSNKYFKLISEYYLQLPFFLKPGIKKWGKSYIHFDNGSYIKSSNANKKNVNHLAPTLLSIIDYAFIVDIEELYIKLFPSMSSRVDSKIDIISAPNGYNSFERLVDCSERLVGDPLKNSYVTNRVHWWEVPGRDLEWRNKTIIELNNNEKYFMQQYELKFITR